MYYVLKSDRDDRNVYVSSPPSFEDWDELIDGISLLEKWPQGLTLEFSEDRSEGMLLTDRITNTFSWLIASKKFKNLLEQLKLDYIEFLPVGFLDHKGRPRDEPYWIVNFTAQIPAVDQEKSVFINGVGGTLDFFKN